jgi:hypothetical protein
MGIMRWITLTLWLVIGLRNMSTGGGAVSAWQYGCAWFLLILHLIGDLLNYYEHGDGR